MTGYDIQVAQVVMPEKGLFLVRCACPPPPLDYGQDVGTVMEGGPYDPARHGARLPGFLLVREKTEADDAVLAENETLALAMRTVFVKVARATVPDLRVPYVRLSFARTRLFIRFVSGTAHPDFAQAVADLRHRFGVSVNVWQMGPRDEVSIMGGLGPCGRPCCCATWQARYPAHLTAERFKGQNPAFLNGACGRFKCCLAFEDAERLSVNRNSERK